MAFFITVQILLDLGVAGYLVWSFLQKKNEVSSDSWKKEWEIEKQNLEQQVATQLRSMRMLNEQVKKLMDERQMGMAMFPISQEETELKQLMNEKPIPMIPTLAEFESQKERLKLETPLDLRTLLSEQLC